MTELNRTSLYQLVLWHVQARGEFMESREEADVVFDADQFPFEGERIGSEFLG
jgi:hypothetical protein